ILQIAERADRIKAGFVTGVAPGEFDAPRSQEGVDALVARSTVDVAAVVRLDVERLQRFRPGGEESVECLLPGLGMDLGRGGENAVEIEQHSLVAAPVEVHARPAVSSCCR